MNTAYGFGTTLNVPYEEAIPRVKEALNVICLITFRFQTHKSSCISPVKMQNNHLSDT
jgi:hypothetical protein